MTKDEALNLALDLAIMHHSDDGYAELRSKVRQLAKEALAPTSTQCEVQPEQEPIAIAECKVVHGHMCQFLKRTRHGMDTLKDGDKLYTAPPKRPWVGLTELEKAELWGRDAVIPFSYADAIEAKLKEKNT